MCYDLHRSPLCSEEHVLHMVQLEQVTLLSLNEGKGCLLTSAMYHCNVMLFSKGHKTLLFVLALFCNIKLLLGTGVQVSE